MIWPFPFVIASGWASPSSSTIEAAILQTIAYADVFDYPLTVEEVHRYLVGMPASLAVVRASLNSAPLSRLLVHRQEFFALPGRASLVTLRRRRAEVARKMWTRATHYGRMMAALPFVRMVAVTGALAMDNVEPGDDMDYLIITEPGRLWLCRALIIVLVKLAARRGDFICPNYLLSERALVFQERTLYTAHELTQMVPLAGLTVYHRLRRLNGWTARFLPNAAGPPRSISEATPLSHPVRALAESALRTPLGGWLERWEMQRKVRKLSRQDGPSEANFCADWCKGHFQSHGQHTLEAFTERLRQFEGRT
ncbi:MAG: hypothetical protein N0A15_10285 [Anaerolineae bacterium]|nr:hypothetical protein [Anaerolineae bacterium]